MNELFDEIMAKKEEKEKAVEVETRLNADPNDPSTWSEEMIADYFIETVNSSQRSLVAEMN